MIKIAYPPYQPKIKTEANKELIFDEVRKQWVSLTPEEWVRQNFLQYLICVKNYPSSLIAVEKELKLGELRKRADIVVYNKQAVPFLLVECKEMDVPLDEKVLQQALRYNMSIPVQYIIITNGSYCFGFERANTEFLPLDELPDF